MADEEEDDFFSFEEEQKEHKKSRIEGLEQKVEKEASLFRGKLNLPEFDYVTLFLVVGEAILLVYGLVAFLL